MSGSVPRALDKITIGTRGSKLALVQTNMVAAHIKSHFAHTEVAIEEILTSGDWKPSDGETRLSEAKGGKGQFAKEIEQAITSGRADCGVHSMKDMESFLPDGLVINHMLPREDERDAFLSNDSRNIESLKEGAVIGTSSLRRQAFILAKRPDLKIVPLRGNVPTRIQKLRSGQVDATLLALSGLKRLGLESEIASVLEPEDMLPAAGQGAVGIEMRDLNCANHENRARDYVLSSMLDQIHCRETGLRVFAERAALKILDGSCRTPIGAHAVRQGGRMNLRVIVASPDGSQIYEEAQNDDVKTVDDAIALGARVGDALKKTVPSKILTAPLA